MPAMTSATTFDVLAFFVGVASMALAYWLLAFEALAYFLFHFGPPMGRPWRSFVLDHTGPFTIASLTFVIFCAPLAGCFGYTAALRSRQEGASLLAASAARLSLAGLAGVA
jgi:hypothetical protein